MAVSIRGEKVKDQNQDDEHGSKGANHHPLAELEFGLQDLRLEVRVELGLLKLVFPVALEIGSQHLVEGTNVIHRQALRLLHWWLSLGRFLSCHNSSLCLIVIYYPFLRFGSRSSFMNSELGFTGLGLGLGFGFGLSSVAILHTPSLLVSVPMVALLDNPDSILQFEYYK